MPEPADPLGSDSTIRDALERFEEALWQGAKPEIDAFLAATNTLHADQLRRDFTADLVFAEFEYRLKSGEPARVEEYLARYLDAFTHESLIDLIVTEWSIRRRNEATPPADSEYQTRFPREYDVFLRARERRSVVPSHGVDSSSMPMTGAIPAPRSLPSLFGRFELREVIGEGAFGIVYRAWDPYARQHLAVKIAREHARGETEGARTFLREARIASHLKHPNIVRVLEAGTEGDDNTPYHVADLIEGRTLANAIADGPLPFATSAQLMATIADALSYAHEHERHVVHRDLKPSNILLDANDNPHLTDFGFAQRDGGELSAVVLPKGSRFGTIAYMSPEQARGIETLAPASDIFSAGIIFFEMLTGELPFRGREPMLLAQIISDDPPSPRRLNDAIPSKLEAICLKMLAKRPEDRHGSAARLRDDLRDYLDEVPTDEIITEETNTWTNFSNEIQGRPLRSLAIAYFVLSGLIATPILMFNYFTRTPPAAAIPATPILRSEPIDPVTGVPRIVPR